jgi:hypothetical protein
VKQIGRSIRAGPTVRHGRLTFGGTRILVANVPEQGAAGMSWEQIVVECGSIKEAAGGRVNNRESLRVRCAWLSETEQAHAGAEPGGFAKPRAARARRARAFDLPGAAKRKLLEYSRREDRPISTGASPKRRDIAAQSGCSRSSHRLCQRLGAGKVANRLKPDAEDRTNTS